MPHHTKENKIVKVNRVEAVRAAMFRSMRAPAITHSLVSTQRMNEIARQKDDGTYSPSRIYFADIDPKKFRSCQRQVEKDMKKIRDQVPIDLQASIPNAAAEIVAQLDQMIQSGWQAWEGRSTHPIKAAAGIKVAFDALIRKARILRVDVDARFESMPDGTGMNLAAMIAQRVADMAVELRSKVDAKLLAGKGQVIDVGSSSGSTETN